MLSPTNEYKDLQIRTTPPIPENYTSGLFINRITDPHTPQVGIWRSPSTKVALPISGFILLIVLHKNVGFRVC